MLAALLLPVYRRQPVHLIDVWDPGRVLAAMLEDGLSSGQGATYFLTSLLDHPDFDVEKHGKLMPAIGLGGSAVPAAVGERAERLGIATMRSFGSTEHPSITGSRPRRRATSASSPTARRSRASRSASSTTTATTCRPASRGRDLEPRPGLLRRLHRPGADRAGRSRPAAGS